MQLKLNSNTLNEIQIQLKRNKMQIGAKCIENMLITSIIRDYDF
jgi:hypothetical protein